MTVYQIYVIEKKWDLDPMFYIRQTLMLKVFLTILSVIFASFSRCAEAKTYRFTSTVRLVISPSSPAAVLELPFAAGQNVTGTFTYAPEDAVLAEPPADGQASYLNGFKGLSLSIDLGSSEYKLHAPDVASAGATPLGGRPLNRIAIDDNILNDVNERADRFGLYHSNSFFFDKPLAQVDPASTFQRFFPSSFFAAWGSVAEPGQPMPSFITDFSLPDDINELFALSESDNWALQFLELPVPGTATPGRSVNVLGRIQSLIVIPEPATSVLLGTLLLSLGGARRVGTSIPARTEN